jgi:hypothetical protein
MDLYQLLWLVSLCQADDELSDAGAAAAGCGGGEAGFDCARPA